MDSTTTSAASTATVVVVSHLRRLADDIVNSTLAPTSAEDDNANNQTDPKVFWSVNAFIFALLLGVVCYCSIYGDSAWFTQAHQRRRQTDEEYQATLRAREEKRKQRQRLSPEKRRALLLASFRKNQVSMTVEEKDIIPEDPEHTEQPVDVEEQRSDAEEGDASGSVTSMNHNTGSLRLPTGASVPNCCAICLGDYEVGDIVVWSSNPECPHAFHQECLLDWLIKMQPATPCPCCRQEFTDWEEIAKERKIKWTPDNAFNLNAIGL